MGVIPPIAALPVNVTLCPTDKPWLLCVTVIVALPLDTAKGLLGKSCVIEFALNFTELPPPVAPEDAADVNATV